jgi:DNA-binding ferritin-like protein (Dps family)
MTEEIKDVNAKIDEAEEAVKKYASKDTVISIGGYEFTPAKLMVAFTLVSSLLGGLYGCFEVYKDYTDMKKKIANYVTPDLTEIYKKMEVLDANTTKMTEYSESIKGDLKNDVRRLEGVVESLERSSKTDQRLTDATVKDIKRDVDQTLKEIRKYTDENVKDMNKDLVRNQKEQQAEIRALRSEVDDKVKKALDNPLNNK